MLSEIFGTLSFFQPSFDDDFIDRLNYYYTTSFVIGAAIIISFKTFGGRPLECWLPAQYKSSWEDYSGMKLLFVRSCKFSKSKNLFPYLAIKKFSDRFWGSNRTGET